MQRVKFISSKPLTKTAICRMITNRLDEMGWFSEKSESEVDDLFSRCPVDDLNNLLAIKQYIKWGAGLEQLSWTIDIHDMILAHAYVLNLDLAPLGKDVLDDFKRLKDLKDRQTEFLKEEQILQKKRLAITNVIEGIHLKLFKKKIY